MLSFFFGEEEEEVPPVSSSISAQAMGMADSSITKDGDGVAVPPEFPQWTHNVLVCGFASGKSKLNGEYKMTGRWIQGRPVYAAVEKSSGMCIWFSDGWCLGPRKHLGTTIAMAHNEHKGGRVWMTEKPWRVQMQGEIKDESSVTIVPMMPAIVVGADGSNKALNGCYKLKIDLLKLPKTVRDKFHNKPVYKKECKDGEEAHCMWCCDQGWCIGLESDVGTKTCYAASDDICAVPWLVKTPWKMVRNSGGLVNVSSTGDEASSRSSSSSVPYWSEDSNLQVVANSEAELTGCNVSDGAWNGVYILREDWAALPFFSRRTFRGRPVFRHKTGKQQCMWFSELGWCVGLEKDLGTTRCGIYNKSDASVPWLSTLPWVVLENKQFRACPSLKVAPVFNQDSTKERVARLKAATISAKNKSAKAKGRKMNDSKSSRIVGLEAEVKKLEGKSMELEKESKDICDKFVQVSLSVGLTEAMAQAKLKEAEAVADMVAGSNEKSGKKANLPPLLKTLVSKLDSLKELMEQLGKIKENLEEARRSSSALHDSKQPTTSSQTTSTKTTENDQQVAVEGGMMPNELPAPMVQGLSMELKRQIAEAERKIEEGPDLLESMNPLPVLRDIPLFGDLVSIFAPEPKEQPVHAFEAGRFE
mmetsp:Transcript_17834/g.29555  ORF Transcript_17834/g.29555 Transcript_17834/m.29555 type:complete len:645 (+) Transcript_17834:93-2027(+)